MSPAITPFSQSTIGESPPLAHLSPQSSGDPSAERRNTLPLKSCTSCGGSLRCHDHFCRWCGLNQKNQLSASQESPSTGSNPSSENCPSGEDFYHPITGPMTEQIVRGVSEDLSPLPNDGALQKIVQLLIWIPIWLLILLLSPVDAFCAARHISKDNSR